MIIEYKTSVKVEVTIEKLAELFANLDDDSQCKFFVEVAKYASIWEHHQSDQWFRVGSHLKNCSCSTNEARDMIELIYHGMEVGTH